MAAKAGTLTGPAGTAAAAAEWYRPGGPPFDTHRPVQFTWTVSRNSAFNGAVALERSTDNGLTWERLTFVDGTPMEWTGPVCTALQEPEFGTLYRPVLAANTTGAVAWRLAP